MLCERQRIFKLFKDDCLHAFDLALLGCRKVIKVGAHIYAYRGVSRLHLQVALLDVASLGSSKAIWSPEGRKS